MTYAVKETFLTPPGRGCAVPAPRASSRASPMQFVVRPRTGPGDRARTCDTDLSGPTGRAAANESADLLADHVASLWGDGGDERLVVVTGGEPMLQLDLALIEALHRAASGVAVESNGTLPANERIDWLCISPKAGTEVVQRSGDELKLVWPQKGIDLAELEHWDFSHFLVQPMDCERREEAIEAAVRLAMERPKWRLSLQAHKVVGLPRSGRRCSSRPRLAGSYSPAAAGARSGWRGRLAGRPADGRSVDARF